MVISIGFTECCSSENYGVWLLYRDLKKFHSWRARLSIRLISIETPTTARGLLEGNIESKFEIVILLKIPKQKSML